MLGEADGCYYNVHTVQHAAAVYRGGGIVESDESGIIVLVNVDPPVFDPVGGTVARLWQW